MSVKRGQPHGSWVEVGVGVELKSEPVPLHDEPAAIAEGLHEPQPRVEPGRRSQVTGRQVRRGTVRHAPCSQDGRRIGHRYPVVADFIDPARTIGVYTTIACTNVVGTRLAVSEDNGRDACRSSHDFFPDVHLERACATSGQRPVCANSRACDRELFAGSRQQPRLNSPLTNIKFARPRLVGGSVALPR